MRTENEKEVREADLNLDVLGEIALLPDTLFYYQVVEGINHLTKKQLNTWVQSLIVENSPFPIEQLAWGFIIRKNADKGSDLLWYAGLKERIMNAMGEVANKMHVMPYFSLGFLLAQEGCQMFTGDKYVSVFANKKIFGFYKIEEATFTHVQQSLQKAGIEDAKLARVRFLNAHIGYSGDVKLSIERKSLEDAATKQEITLDSDLMWNADVRDKSFINTLKRQRQMNKISEFGIRAASLFLVFILSFEVCLLVAKLALHFRENIKNRLQPHALSIESKDFLVRKIQSTVEQEIRPFELLGVLNSLRPKSIYFLSALIDNLHNVSMEAISETAMGAEEYRRQLEQSGYFESVIIENITTTHQGTKFTLACDFKEKRKTSFLALETPS